MYCSFRPQFTGKQWCASDTASNRKRDALSGRTKLNIQLRKGARLNPSKHLAWLFSEGEQRTRFKISTLLRHLE
jgi:hypothetical protein